MTWKPSESLILRILIEVERNLGQSIYQTHLVKMVYLVDYAYARQTGKTYSGYRYVYDNYGPDAEGNAVVKTVDALNAEHMINIDKELTPGGQASHLYRYANGATEIRLDDPLADRLAVEIVRLYGGLNWREVVDVAKATEPFLKGAKKGDLLQIDRDEKLVRIEAAVSQKASVGHYESPGQGQSVQELKLRYGLK